MRKIDFRCISDMIIIIVKRVRIGSNKVYNRIKTKRAFWFRKHTWFVYMLVLHPIPSGLRYLTPKPFNLCGFRSLPLSSPSKRVGLCSLLFITPQLLSGDQRNPFRIKRHLKPISFKQCLLLIRAGRRHWRGAAV